MKRKISLLLAFLLCVGMLMACRSVDDPPAATPAPAEDTTPAATPAPEDEAPADDEAPRELHIAAVRFPQHVDWDEMIVWQMHYEYTGIRPIWRFVSPDNLQETRNLMIATGDIPEAFHGFAWTAEEVARFGSEGIFVAINDYLPRYGPNTAAYFANNPEVRNALVMPDGNIYGFPRAAEAYVANTPPKLRRAWVEELGLGMPATTDELLTWMIAARDTFNTNAVYSCQASASGDVFGGLRQVLMGAWGLGNRGVSFGLAADFFLDANPNDPTQLRFWAADPRMQELLAFMNRIHSEGLIDPDIVTQDALAWGAKLTLDPPVIGMTANIITDIYLEGRGAVGSPDEFIGFPSALVGPHGYQMYSSVRPLVHRVANFVITNQCHDVALAVEFADFWMSYENSVLLNFGPYSTHWEWDPTRSFRRFHDWITNDPQGRSLDQMESTFSVRAGGFFFGVIPANNNFEFNLPIASENMRPYFPPIIWESFTFLEEEIRVLSTVGVDIRTYVIESLTGFVNGSLCIEEDWDTYISTLDRIGLPRLMSALQSAYDRYLAHGGR